MRDFLSTLLICAGLAAGVFGLQAALSFTTAEADRTEFMASLAR